MILDDTRTPEVIESRSSGKILDILLGIILIIMIFIELIYYKGGVLIGNNMPYTYPKQEPSICYMAALLVVIILLMSKKNTGTIVIGILTIIFLVLLPQPSTIYYVITIEDHSELFNF